LRPLANCLCGGWGLPSVGCQDELTNLSNRNKLLWRWRLRSESQAYATSVSYAGTVVARRVSVLAARCRFLGPIAVRLRGVWVPPWGRRTAIRLSRISN